MRWLITLVLALSVATPAIAQCESVLRDGTMSRTLIESNDYARTVFSSRIARMSYEEATRALSGDLALPIEGVPLEAGFSSDDHRRFSESYRSSVDLQMIERHESSVLVSTGDPVIVDAWSRCMDREGGLSVRIEPRGSSSAQISVQWHPTIGPRGSPTLTEDIRVQGGEIVSGANWARSGTDLGVRQPRLLTVNRRPGQALLVTVHTNFVDEDAYLPAIPPQRVQTLIHLRDATWYILSVPERARNHPPLDALRQRCDGQSNCGFRVGNYQEMGITYTSDPHPGIHKLFTMVHECRTRDGLPYGSPTTTASEDGFVVSLECPVVELAPRQ